MWAVYTGRDQGIAVKSTLDALSGAFPLADDEGPANLLNAGLVDYIPPEREEAAPKRFDDYTDVLRKRSWYKYEQEVRAFCINARNWIDPSKAFEPGTYKTAGFWVRCNLKKLIQAVVVAPTSPSYMHSALREVLNRFGFDPALVVPSSMKATVLSPNPTLVQEEWMHRFETDK